MNTDNSLASPSRTDPPPSLQPILNEKWIWGLSELCAVAILGLLFLIVSYAPLSASPLWSYATSGNLSQSFPLSEGMVEISADTFSREFFTTARSWGGIRGVGDVTALLLMGAFLGLYLAIRNDHHHSMLAALSVLVAGSIVWLMPSVVQPAALGLLCWSGLLWIIRWRFRNWFQIILVGLVMMIWANAHRSFTVGLVYLICCVLAEVRNVKRSSIDSRREDASRLKRSVLLLEVGLLGFLMNPDLMSRLWDGMIVSALVQKPMILLWHPLVMSSQVGALMGVSWLVVFLLSQTSRGKLDSGLLLTWLVLSAGVCITTELTAWYLPLAVLLIQPSLSEFWPAKEKAPSSRSQEQLTAADFRYTLISLLVVWIAFVFSPISRHVLSGQPRPISQVIATNLPFEATKHLRQAPPPGQVFAPVEWGDWLNYSAAGNWKLFASQASLPMIPPLVMDDYQEVIAGGESWERVLDRYRISTIILSVENQKALIDHLKESERWSFTFDDDQAIVFHRSALVRQPEVANDE